MSKGGGKTSTTSVQSVDPEFKERALEVYDIAKTVANREYQPIIGGLTPTQEAAAYNIFRTAGELPSYLTEARGATRGALPDFAAADAAFYRPSFDAARSEIYRPDYAPATGIVNQASAMPSIQEGQALVRGTTAVPMVSEAQRLTRAGVLPTEYAEARQFARTAAGYQPGTIASGMGAYMNPYETGVVETALGDIERSRQLAVQQGAAQATRARAYGGSRQAVAESETNRAALEQAARTAAQLRQQGFVTAGEMAGRDIGYGLQGAQQRLSAAQQLGALTQAEQAGLFSGAGQLGQLALQAAASETGRGTALGQLGVQGTQAELARAGMLGQFEQAKTQAGLNIAQQLGAFEQAQAQTALQEAQQRAAMAQATSGARLAQGQQLGNLALAGTQGQISAQQASFNAQEALRANEEARRAEAFGYPERQLQILQQALGFFPNPITQTQTQRQTLGPMDIISRLGGTAATGASAYALLCWVAREVYGAENPRWLMFRHWVITDAPKWFLRLYIKYGEKFAAWISNKPTLKNAIRAFMDRKIQKKFGGGHV